MWKSIVLCVSLFGGAALGLALGARFVEPAALPAAAAIGLCVIGVVLILAAPTSPAGLDDDAAHVLRRDTSTVVTPLEAAPLAATTPAPKNRTPTLPFEALNQ
jgi:hypothetical protein